MEAIELKRELSQSKQAADLVEDAIKLYPKFARFWLLKSELLIKDKQNGKVRENFEKML